jgi:cell division protein FtsB
MLARLSQWSRRSLIYAGLAAAGVIWFQQTGFRTLMDLRQSLAEERALAAEVRQLEAENAALDAEIQSLQKEGWEKLARERLGLAKPGEYVVKIPGKK